MQDGDEAAFEWSSFISTLSLKRKIAPTSEATPARTASYDPVTVSIEDEATQQASPDDDNLNGNENDGDSVNDNRKPPITPKPGDRGYASILPPPTVSYSTTTATRTFETSIE